SRICSRDHRDLAAAWRGAPPSRGPSCDGRRPPGAARHTRRPRSSREGRCGAVLVALDRSRFRRDDARHEERRAAREGDGGPRASRFRRQDRPGHRACDGFFSLLAETHGAARVVACDHFAWALDREAKDRYKADCKRRRVPPEAFDRVPSLWRFDDLPGKRGVDLAHARRGSRVEPPVADYMTMKVEAVGAFDVALYLGGLYYMEN